MTLRMKDVLQGMCDPDKYIIKYCVEYKKSWCEQTCFYSFVLEDVLNISEKKMRRGLHSKVMNFFPFKDKGGKFISYCDYERHRGIVLKPKTCETRKCKHYNKMYIEKK